MGIFLNFIIAVIVFLLAKYILEAVGLVGILTILIALALATWAFVSDPYGRYQNRL